MKVYKVKIENGAYPLEHVCKGIHEVYECISAFDENYDIGLDREYLIKKLAELDGGNGYLGFKNQGDTATWMVSFA